MPDTIFLDAAERIARRLCRDALWAANECNWLGWAVDVFGANWSVVYKAQSAALYDGTAGIALFLARMHRATGEPLFAQTAIGALNHSFAALPVIPPEIGSSVYSGSLGIAWSAVAVGRALDDERMMRRGRLEAAKLGKPGEKHQWLDILGGSAGAVQGLIELDLIEQAAAHGDLLLRTAVHSDAGYSWDTMPGQSKQHLCGYGHGAGGIGCALLELWSATGEKRFRQAAQEAFRYERSHYSPQHRNWPDLRDMTGYSATPNQQVFAMGWCHGAPGVGFSRLRAHQILPADTGITREMEDALATTADACRQWVL